MNNSDDLVNSATYRTHEITVHRSSGEERAGEQYEMVSLFIPTCASGARTCKHQVSA
jgi:hypothetical protein